MQLKSCTQEINAKELTENRKKRSIERHSSRGSSKDQLRQRREKKITKRKTKERNQQRLRKYNYPIADENRIESDESRRGALGRKRRSAEYLQATVRRHGCNLQLAPNNPKNNNDKDIVLAVVQEIAGSLRHAAENLKSDRDFMLAAVQLSGHNLKHASDNLRNSKEIVLAAVRQDGCSLQFASDSLKNDKETVLAAVQQNVWSFLFVSAKLNQAFARAFQVVGVHTKLSSFVEERLRLNRVIRMWMKNGVVPSNLCRRLFVPADLVIHIGQYAGAPSDDELHDLQMMKDILQIVPDEHFLKSAIWYW